MKFKNLHIKCENLEQRKEVFEKLDSLGFKNIGFNGEYLQVNADPGGAKDYMTATPNDVWLDSKVLTGFEFINKYGVGELHEKINQAKKNLGLNSSELSTALGYSKPYITKVLNKLPGDKVQKRLIGEVDVLINNEKKRVAEVINCYFDKKYINRSSIDCRVKSKTFNDTIFGRCEAKPDLQLQNSAKSKVLNKERLECRASGSAASVKSIDTGEIIKQKDLKRAKRECELFWSTRAIKDKNNQIEKLQSKISNERTKINNERILSVIIFAVILALFLASHAV